MVKHSKKMYKTIRHGENSLQYTILPQNDDFRLEGRIKSVASGKRAGTSNGLTKPRNRARRTFFAYLGVLFICTILIGAVLIPFLVSTECLPNPTKWFLRTKAALMHRGLEMALVGSNNSSILAINPSNANQSQPSLLLESTTASPTATLITFLTTNSDLQKIPTEQLMEVTSIVPAPDKIDDEGTEGIQSVQSVARVNSYQITTTVRPILMVDGGHTIASVEKLPIKSISPVAAEKTAVSSVVRATAAINKNTIEQQNLAWIQGHWPYIDPSTYFQWNVI